jgi:ankyrin repeat protein
MESTTPEPALMIACRSNDLTKVRRLIAMKADVNYKNRMTGERASFSALTICCLNGNLALVEELLKAKADTKNALLTAIQYNHFGVVEALLNHGFSDREEMKASLLLACKHNNLPIVRALIKVSPAVLNPTKLTSGGETSALIEAMKVGDLAIVRELIQAGIVVDYPNYPVSALMGAVSQGDLAIVEELVKAGADINRGDHTSTTPLMLAVFSQWEDIVGSLLETGRVEIDKKNNDGVTALHVAIVANAPKGIIKKLIDAKADINMQSTREGYTPLMTASFRGHTVAVDMLLEAGANTELKDLAGYTAERLAETVEISRKFKGLKSLSTSDKKFSEECCICLENYDESRRRCVGLIPCGHDVCEKCWKEWNEGKGAMNKTCPMCRQTVTTTINCHAVVEKKKSMGKTSDGGRGLFSSRRRKQSRRKQSSRSRRHKKA